MFPPKLQNDPPPPYKSAPKSFIWSFQTNIQIDMEKIPPVVFSSKHSLWVSRNDFVETTSW